jgi:hypothetical protein
VSMYFLVIGKNCYIPWKRAMGDAIARGCICSGPVRVDM